MADKRQIYRVILQLMTYSSAMVLLWGMFNTLFVSNKTEQHTLQAEKIEMSLQQLAKGKLTQVLWQGKRVAILHRNDQQTGSFFVFYDLGDSGNCPLFFNGKILKDTCTGTQYDQTGSPIERNNKNSLDSPPHFISKQNKLIIGSWK